MSVSFYQDRFGKWWFRVTPPWTKGYRVSTIYPLEGFPG